MPELVFASNNQGKIVELKQILQPFALDVRSQAELGVPEIEETGLSFVENAILKARNAAEHTGLAVIADDSGLIVDALQGRPGIYSARYAGERANDQDNIEKLLRDLQEVPQDKRQARFQCVLVYMRHALDPTPIICQGSWQGAILTEPQGDTGFGYDPVFYVASHQCSAAELSKEDKNKLSHRGKALSELMKKLK